MEKHINKINGNESKLDLMTFIRIRNIPLLRYLSENNVHSLETLDAFVLQLETSSDFSVTDVFKNEAKQLFTTNNIEVEAENNEKQVVESTDQKQENSGSETTTSVINKVRKKKSVNNNGSNTED